MSGSILLVLRILAALSLYAFTGWALYLLWRTLQIQSQLLNTRRVIPISLTLLHPEDPPQNLHFASAEIIIGREPDCQCVLSDATASARHARLSYHHSQWWVEDLQSTNGTRLNGDRIGVPTVIISDDKIGCGHTTIIVKLGGDTRAATTTPYPQPLASEEQP